MPVGDLGDRRETDIRRLTYGRFASAGQDAPDGAARAAVFATDKDGGTTFGQDRPAKCHVNHRVRLSKARKLVIRVLVL